MAVTVVALGVSAPANAAPAKPKGPAACGPLASDLSAAPNDVLTKLTAVPPDPKAALDGLWGVLGTADALQAAQCLPAIPPAAGTEVTNCLDLNLDLVSQLLGALSGLVTVGDGVPDVTGVVALVQKLVETITGLLGADCLPKPAT